MFLFQELSYDLAMTGSQGRLMLLHIPGRYLKGQVIKTSTIRYSGLKQAYCSDRKDVCFIAWRMRVALIYLQIIQSSDPSSCINIDAAKGTDIVPQARTWPRSFVSYGASSIPQNMA